MKSQARVAAAFLAVAGMAAALSGCTSDKGPRAASPTLTPPPARAALAPPSGRDGMMQLPLAAYGSGDGRGETLGLAVRALTVRCMHEAGYAAFTRADALDEGSRPDNLTALPAGAFGYLPESVAAVQGFHAPANTAPANTAVAQDRRALEAAEEQALIECGRKRSEQLGEADRAGSDLVDRLYGESLAAVDRDPRVSAATAAWQDCMGAAGFAGAAPQELVNRYHGKPPTAAGPPPEELAAAKADAACTTRANLAGIWFEVLAGYQEQLIAANQQKLTDHQERNKAFDAKLAEIIADS